jgi:uncharacterized protein (UPF0297 family)
LAAANGETRFFGVKKEEAPKAREILRQVAGSLREKGYDPVPQIVGYLLSGDPAYITSHQNARGLIRQMERDELLEELVRGFLA